MTDKEILDKYIDLEKSCLTEKEKKKVMETEILDKYIDLEKPCLTEKEKKEVMEMLYEYKEAFSLIYEIGTCPNIEVEIGVMDRFPFFIRPCNVKEEDKALIGKEMK